MLPGLTGICGFGAVPTVTATNTAYRYVGVRVLTTGNGFIGATQFSLFEAGSSTDRALAGTAATDYTASGLHPASDANDSSDLTFTTSSSGAAAGSSGVLYIDFGSGNAYSIAKIGWKSRPDTAAENPATWEAVGKQNSGDAWTRISTLPDQSGWSTSEYREVTFTELSYAEPFEVSPNGAASVTPLYSGPGSPSYSLLSGSLPSGLSLNSSTGAITGTATATGTFSGIVVRATVGSNTTDSRSFTITSIDGYKFYFIEVVTTGNTFIGCSTIKLLDATPTDWALQTNSGVASAVSYTVNGSFPVTNVNDGNDTSFTTSNASSAGSGHGILITMPRIKDIAKVGFRSRSDSFGAAEAITSGFVKAKVNSGDSYTTLFTVSEAGWTNNEYREWTMP